MTKQTAQSSQVGEYFLPAVAGNRLWGNRSDASATTLPTGPPANRPGRPDRGRARRRRAGASPGRGIALNTPPAERTDNLTDFKVSGTDVLQFKAAAFGFAPGHILVNGTEFIANTAPVSNHAGPTFLMETDVHNLYFDADGNGAGAAVWIVHMNANAVASDFHLV